jgi:small neutral amino acid transporter SnatA (MarC family)
MDFSVIDFELVAKLLLLLLIGMGPKIALVPFLEKTKNFDAETQRAVGRRMVVTAVVTALVLFAFGALLMPTSPAARCGCWRDHPGYPGNQ